MSKLIAALVAITASSSGCGLHDLGVLSVSFDLHPTAVSEPPAGIDAEVLAALEGTSGTMNADVHADDGHLQIRDMPALPTGFSYTAMGQFADHVRDDLPGAEGDAEAGHSHGPLSSSDGAAESVPASGDLTTINLGALEAGASEGMWEIEFGSADLGANELGGLRSAMVMVIPESGPAVAVLMGEVGEEATDGAAEEEEGHSHGP